MMSISLTKDADKLVCLIYKEFLTRRKRGDAKSRAKDFGDPTKWPESFLSEFSADDIEDALAELNQVGIVKLYINNGFQLENGGLIYMEQRFPNGLAQVLDWLGRFKSAIPFV